MGKGSKNGTAAVQEREVFAITPRTATLVIRGTSDLSWSREIPKCAPNYDQKKHEDEQWRNRLHAENGYVAIPSLSVRAAICEAAQGHKIPGKGQATYASVLRTGVLPSAMFVPTDVKVEDAKPQWLFLPSNPSNQKKGMGGRVHKCMPTVALGWTASLEFMVLNDLITPPVLHEFSVRAGLFVGIGRWRPSNGGMNGRFEVVSINWS